MRCLDALFGAPDSWLPEPENPLSLLPEAGEGQPASKWVTLKALRVLKRVEEANDG